MLGFLLQVILGVVWGVIRWLLGFIFSLILPTGRIFWFNLINTIIGVLMIVASLIGKTSWIATIIFFVFILIFHKVMIKHTVMCDSFGNIVEDLDSSFWLILLSFAFGFGSLMYLVSDFSIGSIVNWAFIISLYSFIIIRIYKRRIKKIELEVKVKEENLNGIEG